MPTKKQRKAKAAFNIARLGLGLGILGIAAASGYMNVSAWMAVARTAEQMWANGAMATGFELTALFALPYAGRVMGRGTYVKALFALGIGLAAVGINVFATHEFLDLQTDLAAENIEGAQLDVDLINDQIADRQQELDSILDRNDGVPRDVDTLEQSGQHFPDDENPINARERDREIGDRRRYEQLTGEIQSLREQRTAPAGVANNAITEVIPDPLLRPFVVTLEFMKAAGLYVLGNHRLFYGRDYKDKRQRAATRPKRYKRKKRPYRKRRAP
ncbi:MAG: hypothetical protein AAF720_06140 [Pseudomonadota bacterium]